MQQNAMIMNDGGGSSTSNEIVMNVDEMQEIMRLITTIHLSFESIISPKVKDLSATRYYEGGEAAKVMEHYEKMVHKMGEVGDLYQNANSVVMNLMFQWLEQDEQLRNAFMASLTPDGQLTQNLRTLFEKEGGE